MSHHPVTKRVPKSKERCPYCGHRVGLSLTSKDVQTIRDLLKNGAKQVDLARAYDVTPQAIWRIKAGRNWKEGKGLP